MPVHISLTAAFDPAQPRAESGPTGGQWTSGSPTADDKAAAGDDEVAKDLFKQMLNMSPDQQAAFLKTLSPDKLHRLGMFANLGSGDKQITAIRTSISGELTHRGISPTTVGATATKAKKSAGSKAPAKGSSKGSGSSKASAPKVTATKDDSAKTTTTSKTTTPKVTTKATPVTPTTPVTTSGSKDPETAEPVRASGVRITMGEKR